MKVIFTITILHGFLNQVRAGLQLARTWFIEITFVRLSVCVFAYVCVCPFVIGYPSFSAFNDLAIDTVNGRGLSNEVHREFLPIPAK